MKLKNNSKMVLTLAINYGARNEILRAVKNLAEDAKNSKLDIDDIDEKLFSKYLYTYDIPDPDLLIRTSGEYRLSNFYCGSVLILSFGIQMCFGQILKIRFI